MARICLDVRFGRRGGGSTYMLNLAPEILRRAPEHEFVLVGFESDWPSLPREVDWIRPPRRNALVQYAWIQARLPRLLRRRAVDLYHSLKHLGPIGGDFARIQSQHAVGHWCGAYPLTWREHFYWAVLGRPIARRARIVACVSRFIADGVVEYAGVRPANTRVVYPGCDPVFTPDDAETRVEGDFLLCVGNLLPVKNQATLLRAMALLRQGDGPRIPLYLVGDDTTAHARELRRLARELQIENEVRFTGYQPKERLLELYRGAALLIMPSLHEGFPFALLEAMACGLPAAVSDRGGLTELGGDAVLPVGEISEPAAWASAIRSLLRDPGRCRALSAAAVRRSSRFTWQRAASDVVDLYREILSDPAGSGHSAGAKGPSRARDRRG